MMPACAIEHRGRVLLYYSGWNRGVTVPYRNAVGIAVSDDDGDTFRAPVRGAGARPQCRSSRTSR